MTCLNASTRVSPVILFVETADDATDSTDATNVGSEGAADVDDGVGCTAGKAGLVTTLERRVVGGGVNAGGDLRFDEGILIFALSV